MSICRFFLCHSRYFSYSFLISTSTQSWRSEEPQGPKARPLGTPSLVQTGKKISRNCGFCKDFTREMLDFQRCLCFLFYFLLQNRWLGFPQKNGRSQGSMIFFEQHPAAEAQALNNGLNTANRWVGATEKNRCTCRIGMIQLNPTGSGAAPLRLGVLSSAQWRRTCCYTQKCRNASCPDDPSCVEFCCLISVFRWAANCAMQEREWAQERQMSVQVPNEPQRLSPYQCWTLIDKLWGPSTTWTERRNVAQGGIANYKLPLENLITFYIGLRLPMGKIPVTGKLSVSTSFNYINPCDSVCIVCSAFCILLRLE